MPVQIVKLRRVRIEWSGPFTLGQVKKEFNDKNDQELDYGLYQIYGHHLIYGPHVLLYIGRAVDQTFSNRFNKHKWLSEENNIQIRLGRLCAEDHKRAYKDKHDDWEKLVKEIEALTIYYHSPAYNSSSVSNYKRADIGLLVQNLGNMGSLLPEYTNLWTKPNKPLRKIPDESQA
jgi:hypothetical protein